MKKFMRLPFLVGLALPSWGFADCEAIKYADADLIAFVRPSIAEMISAKNANLRECNGSRCTEIFDGPPVQHEVPFVIEKSMVGPKKGSAVFINIPVDIGISPDSSYYAAAYEKQPNHYEVYPCGDIRPQIMPGKN